MKIYIATSRPVGEICREYALQNMPGGFELTNKIEDCGILISILYRDIIPAEVLEGKIAFNFHAGKLPEYRGSGALAWAIINNEDETYVTLHRMTAKVDAGNVLHSSGIEIKLNDTAETLLAKVEKNIESLFRFYWHRFLKNKFSYDNPQDETKAHTYYRADLESVKDLTRFVRALTFKDKENAYYYTAKGEKKYLDYFTS